MATVLQPKFSIPNRSKQPVRLVKDEEGVRDIGWCEGVLSDGHAFRAEMWAQDQVSILTIFFSTCNFPDLPVSEMKTLVTTEGLCTFKDDQHQYCDGETLFDDAGNHMWSINIVVGDGGGTFISDSIPIYPYSTSAQPHSLFNPVPLTGVREKCPHDVKDTGGRAMMANSEKRGI